MRKKGGEILEGEGEMEKKTAKNIFINCVTFLYNGLFSYLTVKNMVSLDQIYFLLSRLNLYFVYIRECSSTLCRIVRYSSEHNAKVHQTLCE